jgi:hypothetical protein
MRRSVRALTVPSAVLLLAAPAGATRIEFLWEATGTNHITVLPGAEIVLQAWVVVEEPGISLASVSALATPGLLEALDFEVCPAHASNPFGPGWCGASFATLLEPIGAGNVVLNAQNAGAPGGSPDPTPIPGLSGSFAAVRLGGGPTEGSFVLADVSYRVTGIGSGEVLPYYREGIDGIVENGFTFLLPLADGADVTSGLSVSIVPEPSTAGLLAAGLLALAARRRGSEPAR